MRSLSDSEMDKLIREVGEEFDEPVVGNCPDERAMIVYLVQPWGNRSPALKEHFVACRRCLNTLVKLHREFESFQQTPRSDTVPSEAWERFLADTGIGSGQEGKVPPWLTWLRSIFTPGPQRVLRPALAVVGLCLLGLLVWGQIYTIRALRQMPMQQAAVSPQVVRDLQQSLESAGQQLALLQRGMQAVQSRMEGQEGTLKSVQGVQESLHTVQQQLALLQSGVRDVQSRVERQEGRLQSVRTGLETVQGRLNQVSTRRQQEGSASALSEQILALAEKGIVPLENIRVEMVATPKAMGNGEDRTNAPILLSPVATVVKSPRPTFRWKRVRDVEQYRLILRNVDQGNKTVWSDWVTPRNVDQDEIEFPLPDNVQTLQQGTLYSWEVKVTVTGQRKASSAKFLVLKEESLRKVTEMERVYGKSDLALVAGYETYGLYEEAQKQLEKLRHHPLYQTMVEALDQQRGKP